MKMRWCISRVISKTPCIYFMILFIEEKALKRATGCGWLLFWIASATLSKVSQVNYQPEELITHGCNWSAVESGQIRRAVTSQDWLRQACDDVSPSLALSDKSTGDRSGRPGHPRHLSLSYFV